MKMKELKNFIKFEDKRLKDRYGITDEEKRILARTVKLGEEFGELCDEVLAYNSMQRKDKLNRLQDGNLSEEFADVLITTLLLAESMQIDFDKALEIKIGKITKRNETI